MATVTLRLDRFPTGTTVGIYPRTARGAEGGAPSGTAIASAAVDAAGLLTVTNAGIVDNTPYVAYALVAGENRYVNVSSSTTGHNPGTGWAGVVAARRSGMGTS